jgi:hypothetical protein
MFNTAYNICSTMLLIVSFLAFFVGLKYKKVHKELDHLFIYSISSFFQMVFYKFSYLFNFPNKYAVFIALNISIYIFLIIELFCLYFFFYKIRPYNKTVKKNLPYIFVFCILFYIALSIRSNFFLKYVEYIYYMQSLIILIPCFLYLYQLFIQPPILNLLNEASFWFFSGILIYFILTLPLFFMIHYFKNKGMWQIIGFVNMLGYCLIFLFLIRAYLCKPQITI